MFLKCVCLLLLHMHQMLPPSSSSSSSCYNTGTAMLCTSTLGFIEKKNWSNILKWAASRFVFAEGSGSEVTSSQRHTCWTTCQVFSVISCTSQDGRGRKATSQQNWQRGLVAQMWEESAFSALFIVGAFLCLSEHVELRSHNARDLLRLRRELTLGSQSLFQAKIFKSLK